MEFTRKKLSAIISWSEKYTKTDMNYLVKGGFWWSVGKAGLFLISFLTMIAFANWLPKEGYGTYQFVLAGLALFSIFTLPGINTSIVKSIAKGKEGTLKLAIKHKMKWGTIGSLLSFALAIYYFFQGNNLLATAFLIGAFFVPFKETFHIFADFWNGRKRFDQQAKYKVLSALFSGILIILAIYLTNNVLLIVFVFLAGYTFFDWFFYQKTKKQRFNDQEDKEAISFGKNLTLMNALQTAATYLDKIIIWNFLGAIPVAVYSFAQLPIQKIREALPITALALPKLSESKIDKEKKKRIIAKFLRLFLIAVPAAAFLILIAPFVYKVIFPQYIESVVYFQGLSIVVALSPFLLLNAALIAEIKKGALYITNITAPLLKIVLFLALIPYLEIWGIVLAILIAELLRGFLSLYFFLKI